MPTLPSLTLDRVLKAPASLVYSAWTDPNKMMRWFCPANSEVLYAESNAKVGGRYRVIMRTPDGEKHTTSGEYLEVIPNEKLVFTWGWESEPGIHSQVTVTLREHEGQTHLRLFHEQLPTEPSRDGHLEGWTGALENLGVALAQHFNVNF